MTNEYNDLKCGINKIKDKIKGYNSIYITEEGKIYNVYVAPNNKYAIFDLVLKNFNFIKVIVWETPLKEFLDSLKIEGLRKGMGLKIEGTIGIYENLAEGNSSPLLQIVAKKLTYKSDIYFEPEPKEYIKPIPILRYLPAESIAVITGKNNKGFNDFKDQLGYKLSQKLIVREVNLQGDKGIKDITREIALLHDLPEVELICIVRGGGDDLNIEYVFNDEAIYNAIYTSEIPVLIAIGHFDDKTYADEASDAPEVEDAYGNKQRKYFSVPATLGRYLRDLYYQQKTSTMEQSKKHTPVPEIQIPQSLSTPEQSKSEYSTSQNNPTNDYSRIYQLIIFILLVILAYFHSQKLLP